MESRHVHLYPLFPFSSELYYLIVRFLSAGPCSEANEVSVFNVWCDGGCVVCGGVVVVWSVTGVVVVLQVLRRELLLHQVSPGIYTTWTDGRAGRGRGRGRGTLASYISFTRGDPLPSTLPHGRLCQFSPGLVLCLY